ncbi:MAG: hypothetical protein WC517_04535 [Patescibacteria group bacterium]
MREKPRTDVDFSKHVLTVTEHPDIKIFDFRKPGTSHYAVTFINARGILAVTGDLGNWIFCREFHPSAKGEGVSDGYWAEKLRMSSTQQSSEYSAEEAERQIKEKLKDEDEELDDKDKEYLKELLEHTGDGEERFQVWAYDNLPEGRDFEFIPGCKVGNPQLSCVFDAFDAMCRCMAANPPAPGPTGDFPEGKLNAQDEGGLQMLVGQQQGKVVLAFGKSIKWIGMGPDQARDLGKMLISRADAVSRGGRD